MFWLKSGPFNLLGFAWIACSLFFVYSSGLQASCEDSFLRLQKDFKGSENQQVFRANPQSLAQAALNAEAKLRRAQFRSLYEAQKEDAQSAVKRLQEDLKFELGEYFSDMVLLEDRKVAFTIQLSRKNPPGLETWLEKNKELFGLSKISVNQDVLHFTGSFQNASNLVNVLVKNYGERIPEFIQLKASREFLEIAEEFVQSSLLKNGRLEYTRKIENIENLLHQMIEVFYRVKNQLIGFSGETFEKGRLPRDFYMLKNLVEKKEELSEPVQEFLDTPFKVMLPIQKEYLLFMLSHDFQRNYEGRLNENWDADFKKLSKEVNGYLQTELHRIGLKKEELSIRLLKYDHLNEADFPLLLHGGKHFVELRATAREHLSFFERIESSNLDFLFEGYGEAKIDL